MKRTFFILVVFLCSCASPLLPFYTVNYRQPSIDEMRQYYFNNSQLYSRLIYLGHLLGDTIRVKTAHCYTSLTIGYKWVRNYAGSETQYLFEQRCGCNCGNAVLFKAGADSLFIATVTEIAAISRQLKVPATIIVDPRRYLIIPYKKIQDNFKEPVYKSFMYILDSTTLGGKDSVTTHLYAIGEAPRRKRN